MLFAQRQDIRNASNIIEEVEDVVMNFKSYAEKVEIIIALLLLMVKLSLQAKQK